MVKLGNGKQPPRAIDFTGPDGKRKRIRLGVVTHSDAETAKRRIARLVTCRKLGQELENQTLEWFSGLSDELHQRIARAGLCEPREKVKERPPLTVSEFLDAYIESRAIKKANTRRNYEVTRNHLLNHFGRDTLLIDVTAGDADGSRYAAQRPSITRAATHGRFRCFPS